MSDHSHTSSDSTSSTDTSMDSMMSMSMGTFHWSSSGDAIFFDSWMPKSESAYIGTCIGLFVFAILSRGMMAIETYFVAWISMRFNKVHENDQSGQSELSRASVSYSIKRPVYPSRLTMPVVPPFVWHTDTVRSFLTAFASFINYLLMLVVMTGNGGYFIVVIVGIFVGEMAFGRFRSLGGFRDDHCS
ncbi:Ctr copper transporter family-domain-containing protein [Phycomyces blakesleeanus]|uniref:Copper transport protein n=1 Tax=Phycomyces blakesleeanus TaxID=4837 RepID=A0ABR3BA29_PHYBL